ncbi:hypothetical protein BXZ70DRAFT_232287 [Cristinia sonorae]|uniref:Uncharacterized protein n=1 Tax=Cristinia sonorae TaxID=1940300 RepID=A0A8K0XNZ6_9AGAR|nr:hypothetical protein BXZ70DRAFT_232287 [Cristinia sonorae]
MTLLMTTKFQKRKANKTSARTTAFQSKKQAIYNDARKHADTAIAEGVAYIEQYKKTVMELKAQEISADQQMQDVLAMTVPLDDAVEALLSLYPTMYELSHRRAAEINDGCETIEINCTNRQLSRRRIIRDAKARMEEQMENQRTATDASNLIKHYKSLLLS